MSSARVVTVHLAFSLLMFHPSAPLLSDYLFDTARQSLIFTDFLLGLSRPSMAGPVHFRNSEDDFGYIANLPHSTGHEPNQPDKMVPADDDPTPINDPDHDSICDFSKATQENSRWFGVPTMCESPYPTEHSQVETAIYLRRKSLETGQRMQRRRSLETAHIDKPLETKAEWWQKQK